MKHKEHNIYSICFDTLADQLAQRTRYYTVILVLLFLTFSNTVFSQNALVPFTFNLASSAKTSAGVYKKDGTLIRTLWGGVTFSAGTHTKTWDRKDDEGLLVSDTGLVVKVLSNNVNYNWDGVIGNTSDSMHGHTVIRSYYGFESMAIYGSKAYYATGYSEGSSATASFLLSKPQQKIDIMPHNFGTNLAVTYAATDGNYVYWTGFDPYGGAHWSTSKVSMTYATKVSDDAEVLFSTGSPVQMGTGRIYKKAINIILNNTASLPTGLAVQKTGKYLFVAHGGMNKINVLNKTTGAAVTSITMTNPRELCIDGNDDLWIISGTNTIERYAVDSATGTIASSASLSITGLLDPLSLAVSPNNYQVVIIDGGASQQIKAFSNLSGDSLWTFGQYGGYETDPAVTNDKFYFSDTVSANIRKQFIAFQPDSSFWVNDGGNERMQHYTHDRTFIDYVMFMPATYTTAADRNDPTRVFNQYLEFKIDYSKPLAPNNGSWKLVRNWRHGIPSSHINVDFISAVFQNVITMSNGKTYATIEETVKSSNSRYPVLVELPASGHIRMTGIKFSGYSNEIIELDGSRTNYNMFGNYKLLDTCYWDTQALSGFDGANNPLWTKSVKIASINAKNPKDPSFVPSDGKISYPAKTSSDILAIFNTSLTDEYHLGGVKVGTNKFLWKTAKSTFKESAPYAGDGYQGDFPTDGSYDISNGVKVGGGEVYALEKNIFWNYHGEFWKGGQTNIWNHVYDDGLLVGQFGISTRDALTKDVDAGAMLAGNVFSSTVVKVGADYYIYHNDESVHSGLHRWKITGLNTIQEQTIAITYSTAKGGLLGAYFDGTDLNSFNRKAVQVDSTVNLITAPKAISNPAHFSSRWTGYVQPAYSQNYTFYTKVSKGVRLWVNNQPIINQWKNNGSTEYSSAAIQLEAGVRYTINMEISGGAAELSWSSNSQAKQIIPSARLYPADIPTYTGEGMDLMEGLPFRSVLEDSLFGWNRNPAKNDNTNGDNWYVRTSVQSFDKNNPDVQIRFRSNNKSGAVTRSLGKTIPCMTSWKITGNISYDGNDPNSINTNFGSFFDVLDNNGKIISRITHEVQYGSINTSYIKCNGIIVASQNSNLLALIVNKLQPFEIYTDSLGVTFKLANFNSVKVKLFDTSSNWRQPANIKFHFTSSTYYPNYDKAISVQKLRFLAEAPALPEISTSGATEFCDGDSVTLTSTAASSYLWSNSATTQSIKVTNTGNYTVIIKDTKGCPIPSDTTKVIVNPIPVATITASGPTTFCQGGSVTLTAPTAATYIWSNNQTTKSVSLTNPETLTVQISDALGCTSDISSPTQVNVNPLPPVPVISADQATTFCMGDTVTLTSSQADAYLWSNNATTRSIQVNNTGNYQVSAFDLNGCANQSVVKPVIVNIIPNTVVTASGPTSFCEGEVVTLTSSPAVSYLWSNNETTQSIIVDVTADLMVVTKDANECFSVSNTTSVNVDPLPMIPSITANNNVLTSSSVSGNQWYFNDVIINGANAQTYSASASGNYRVEVSEGNNCKSVSDPFNYIYSGAGLSSVDNKNAFIIIPNPNQGRFEIRNRNSESGNIRIYNALGSLVYESQNVENTINASHLTEGVYMLEWIFEEMIYKSKLVIQ